MAYHIETDIHTCAVCGSALSWDAADDVHGTVWNCEECGRDFCSKCFIDKFGCTEYEEMIRNSNLVYCPGCWGKHRREVKGAIYE